MPCRRSIRARDLLPDRCRAARRRSSLRRSPSSRRTQDDEKLARATCGGCHAFPPPDILPRDRWRDEFVRMMFIRENRLPPIGPPDTVYRSVQLPPDMTQVLSFYLARAPERLPAPDAWPDPGETPVRFVRHGLTMPDMPGAPAVSNVSLVDFDGDGRLDVLGTDMRQGVVFTGRPCARGRDVVGRRQRPVSVARDLRRPGSRRHQGPARRRHGRVLSRRSQEGRRDLAARAGQGQVQRRVVAGRLAARGRRRDGRLQRRRQERSGGRRLRLAHDRTRVTIVENQHDESRPSRPS